MTNWIFQTNPKKFDIDQELKTTSTIQWSINYKKHQEIIQADDTVYIWKSDFKGQTGGIIAKAKVTSKLGISKDNKFYVLMEICDYLQEGYLERITIEDNQILKNLQIIKVRTGNNFLLNEEETKELERMWDSITEGLITIESHGPGVYGAIKTIKREDLKIEKKKVLFETDQYESFNIFSDNSWKVEVSSQLKYIVYQDGDWGEWKTVPTEYVLLVINIFQLFDSSGIQNQLDEFCKNYRLWYPHPTSYKINYSKDGETVFDWKNHCGSHWEFEEKGILPSIVDFMKILRKI